MYVRRSVYRGGGLGADIWSTITQGIQSASGILGARYAVPQLAPGQYMMSQVNPYTGATTTSTGYGYTTGSTLGTTNLSEILPIALIGLLVIGGLSMMKR